MSASAWTARPASPVETDRLHPFAPISTQGVAVAARTTSLPASRARPELRACIFPNGEVAWPNYHAKAAVEAIAAAGKIVAGLDARTLYDDGTMTEVPISARHEHEGEAHRAAVERARREALDALAVARSEGTHILIDWM